MPLPLDTDIRSIAQYLCSSIAVLRRKWIALNFNCGCFWKVAAKIGKRKAYSFLPLSQAETETLPKLAKAFSTMPHTVADWSEVASDKASLKEDQKNPLLELSELPDASE
jgi:hypothetical protein